MVVARLHGPVVMLCYSILPRLLHILLLPQELCHVHAPTCCELPLGSICLSGMMTSGRQR